MQRTCSSFGLVDRTSRRPIDAAAGADLMRSGRAEAGSLLAFGNGRSYGDTCLNDAGTLVDMRGMNRILSFDAATGDLRAEAGVLLSELIAHAAPHGFFLPVVPGTRHVTLGGAIANDVHGKNHHRRGTFGCHVRSLTLMRSDGTVHECRPDSERRLFRATIGGMGLTGLILSATIRLMKVGSPDVQERVRPFSSLEEYFELAAAADADNEYAVAWIDQLAAGRRRGRGILMTANHIGGEEAFRPAPRARLAVPFTPPFSLLNRYSLAAFNRVYHWRKGRVHGPRRTGYGSYFFPLDGVRDWNRLYGPRGLRQHQSVVPEEVAREAVPALLEATHRAGQASFLTVLKRFGSVASPGLLSFPRPGYTLTLDFPNRGAATLGLLAELDRITIDAGGAVNPYKDARMSAAVFAASFPCWRKFEDARDRAFMSDFWRRTAMTLLAEKGDCLHAAE